MAQPQWQPPQASEDPLVQQHYLAQLALASVLQQAFTTLWPHVLPLDFRNRRRLVVGVTTLLDELSEAAISLATNYYLDLRADRGVTGAYAPPRIDLPGTDAVERMLDESVAKYGADLDKLAAEEVAKLEADYDAWLRAELAEEARRTTVQAVEGDDKALGFARVARADACAFCLTLAFRRTKAGRPGVYKTRTTAGQLPGGRNRYHDNCNCQVEPVFSTDFQLQPHIAAAEDLYDKATEHAKSGDLLNAFRRALAAERKGIEIPPALPPLQTVPTKTNAELMAALLDGIDQAMRRAA